MDCDWPKRSSADEDSKKRDRLLLLQKREAWKSDFQNFESYQTFNVNIYMQAFLAVWVED